MNGCREMGAGVSGHRSHQDGQGREVIVEAKEMKYEK
jgi:hypothetical protein